MHLYTRGIWPREVLGKQLENDGRSDAAQYKKYDRGLALSFSLSLYITYIV